MKKKVLPLMLAILLAVALAFVALALWSDSVVLGVAASVLFLVIGGTVMFEGVVGLPAFAKFPLVLLMVLLALFFALGFWGED